MERRKLERKKYRFKAYFILDNAKHLGFIENFSEGGMFFTTAPAKTPINFSSQTIHKIQFQIPSGETLTIFGEIRGLVTETSPYGLIYRIGIKIIELSKEYRQFLKTYY